LKKIISITLALFFVLSFAVLAYAYDNFVDDSAMLFSSDETSEITDCVESFSLETGYSLAVVTTDDSMGKSSDEYADDYLDDLIDNQCWSEDSMLFLIDMDNREIYISTTGSAMDSYDSFQIDNIIDSGYSELVQGNYARAVILMTETAEGIYNESNDENYDNIYGYIGSYEDYGYNEYDYDYYDYVDNNRSGFSVDFTDILVYIIVGIGAAGITVLIVKSKYKNHGKDDNDLRPLTVPCQHTGQSADAGGSQQNDQHGVLELLNEALQKRGLFRLLQLIGSVLFQAFPSLPGGQTLRARFQRVQNFIHRLGVELFHANSS